MPSVWVFSLTVLIVCQFSLSEGMTCPPPKKSSATKPIPKIPDSYTAYMEWWDKTTRIFNYREEFVDQVNNVAAVRMYGMYEAGDVYVFISDYNTNQLIIVSENKQGIKCRATNLDPAGTEESFPAVFFSNGSKEHIASTHTFLNFGALFNEQYLSTVDIVRNKMADIWKGCYHDKKSGRTIQTTYFFSSQGWFPNGDGTQVPLRSDITSDIPKPGSKSSADDKGHSIQIDYVYFSAGITDRSIFETASGMYCPGRKPSKPAPSFPDVFKFRSQILLPPANEMGVYNEIYDLPAKIVRVEATTPGIGDPDDVPDGPRRRTSILDFNAGLTYRLATDTGRCEIIDIRPYAMNTRNADGGYLRMATPLEFSQFGSANFTYSGKRTIHGIVCDGWTAPVNFVNDKSIWTWYFNTKDWFPTSTVKQQQVPVMLEITIEKDVQYQYNIYDFDTSAPDWDTYDISDCFQHTESRRIQFNVIGNVNETLSRPKMFRQQMILKLANTMKVSVLEINHFESKLDAVPPFVTFTLLSRPTKQGDVEPTSTPSTASTTLEQAVHKLDEAVNSGSMSLQFKYQDYNGKDQMDPIKAVPDSIKQWIEYKNGTVVDPRLSGKSITSTAPTTKSSSSSLPKSTSSPSAKLSSSSTSKSSSSSTSKSSSSSSPKSSSSSSPASNFNKSSSTSDHNGSSIWSKGKVAGLGVSLTILGLILGIFGTVMFQRFKKQRDPMNDPNNYRMM